jgi:hypothetical protein
MRHGPVALGPAGASENLLKLVIYTHILHNRPRYTIAGGRDMTHETNVKAERLGTSTVLWALAVSLLFSAAFYLQG